MIDITKAKEAFKEYIKNYNPEDKKIPLKIDHIERTTHIARKTAENINLDKEDKERLLNLNIENYIGLSKELSDLL